MDQILFCSMLLPSEKRIAERVKTNLPGGISLHKLSSALIKGLDANWLGTLNVLNTINVPSFPDFPQIFFRTETWHHRQEANDWHLGFVNLFGIKYLTLQFSLYKKFNQLIRAIGDVTTVILVHNIHYPVMRAALRAKRKYGEKVKVCLITGDITGQFGLEALNKHTMKQRLIHILEKKVDALSQSFDGYVFATEAMAHALHVHDKPYVIIEGIFEEHEYGNIDLVKVKKEEKIIFYAGSIREEYGIRNLLEAFRQIRKPDYRLWIAGGGIGKEMLTDYLNADSRIEYLGFLTPKEVYARQNAATVLISPRTSQHEFVRYSFPSKTMECLASGKPFIAFRLPCVPKEYDDHIIYPQNETIESLIEAITETCELPEYARKEIGNAAREFILQHKRPEIMCQRITADLLPRLGIPTK